MIFAFIGNRQTHFSTVDKKLKESFYIYSYIINCVSSSKLVSILNSVI